MGELTQEQQRALTLARARQRAAQAPAPPVGDAAIAARHDAAYARPVMGPNANTPNMAGTARTDNTYQTAQGLASRSGMTALDVGTLRARERSFGTPVGPMPTTPETLARVDAMRDRVGRAGSIPIQQAVRLPDGAVVAGGQQIDATALARQLREESPALAASVAALQGLPFVGSWSDEIIGQIGGIIGTNDPAVITEVVRAIDRTYSQDMPVTSGLIKLGSGLGAGRAMALAATPAVAATAPATPLGRVAYGVGAGASLGAAEGAVYGAGQATDDNRTEAAWSGANVGAILGGVAGGAVPVLASAVRGIRNLARSEPVRNAAQALGVSDWRGVRDMLRGTPTQEAARALNISERAVEDLRRAVAVDDAAGSAGVGERGMLADIGPATAGQLDAGINAAAMVNSTGIARIAERARNEYTNVLDTLDSVLGEGRGRIATRRAIVDETADETRTAYNAAYATPIDMSAPESAAILDALSRVPDRFLTPAVRNANEWLALEDQTRHLRPLSVTRNASGEISITGDITGAHLDLLKRQFDEMVSEGTDPITRQRSGDAVFAARLASRVREAGRAASPELATALSISAPTQARRAAAENGFSLMAHEIPSERAREVFSEMNQAERTAAAEGMRNYISEMLENVRASAASPDIDINQVRTAVNNMTSDRTRAKLTSLLGAESATRIIESIDRAKVALILRARTVRGAQTAGRQAATAAGRASVEEGIVNRVRNGSYVSAVREIGATATGGDAAARAAREAGYFADLAEILTRSNDGEAVRALNLLRDVNIAQPISAARATVIANQVAAVIAAEIAQQAGEGLR